ncbi:MAG: hypothetical protein COU11_01620 [Candidatus Harrisonbacteria bacterium CG10_big_fil_rev_8_21_14_0_10_49_15]|uniref:DUF3494 domain-containing protein n=1 Tax=Candidatus Harrisonbacteria bacterium CG10_big_fil_rev_8_21_14_0_10_49_15 TaxID=1974587 RepID=A0A2H0ULG9_9BACT|nr:MAG: hypothetical protein COU11_01620 [Candidatus Harrisonbacteria bacterium CG10_big_fil_rev_8_21_14_0_10_49_15]
MTWWSNVTQSRKHYSPQTVLTELGVFSAEVLSELQHLLRLRKARPVRIGAILLLSISAVALLFQATPKNNAPIQLEKLTSSYQELIALPCEENLSTQSLVDATLKPGVYCIKRDFRHTGVIEFDGRGDPNAQFILQIHGRFIADPGAVIQLTGKTKPENVIIISSDSITISANNKTAGILVAKNNIFIGQNTRFTGTLISAQGTVEDNSTLGTEAIANSL